jgi:hypothetical protein
MNVRLDVKVLLEQPGLVAQAIIMVMAIIAQPALAQLDTLWTRTYGGSNSESGFSLCQMPDGGYAISGYTCSFGTGSYDVYVVRTDANGDTLWTRTFGGEDTEFGYSVATTTDGGVIVAGSTESYGAGSEDFYVIRTDANGDTLWTRTYGGPDLDAARSVTQAYDGGFIIAGYTYSYGAGALDAYVIRTDPAGDTLWTRTYGGVLQDGAFSVAQTSDGNFIVTGTSATDSIAMGVYVFKIDPNGSTIWSKKYCGAGWHWDTGESVVQTTDGGYIVAGSTGSVCGDMYDFVLIRTNAYGDSLWVRTYGKFEDEDLAQSVVETPDGGFLAVGVTYPERVGDGDVYLVRTDSNGDTLWTKIYGGDEGDSGYSIAKLLDGGYIVAGGTCSYGNGKGDVYLMKFGPEGGVEEETHPSLFPSRARIWPNPSSGTCWIAFGTKRTGTVRITMFDLGGRMVQTIHEGYTGPGSHQLTINTRTLASGIYFFRLDTPDGSHSERLTSLR